VGTKTAEICWEGKARGSENTRFRAERTVWGRKSERKDRSSFVGPYGFQRR
jgi:hypothetical protein